MPISELIQSLRRVTLQESFWCRYFTSIKKYSKEVGINARSRIFVWSFQPIGKDLKDMPVFYWVDLMRFPTGVLSSRHPQRYLKFLVRFWVYQRNMRSRSWSSLSIIYHRPLVLWYYYTLFWWAEYCGVLPDLLNNPDLSLIPELFIRYIVKIDAIIDRNDGRDYLLDNLPFIKRDCADILGELLAHIGKPENDLDAETQKHLVDAIWKFRHNSQIVSRQAQRQPDMDFDTLLEYKERTAGDLSRVWIDLLCNVYPPMRRGENSRRILGAVAMAIQVIDDMLDCPVDHRDNVHNIFIHLLMESPDEFDIASVHFKRSPYDHLDWVWANEHLPDTCRKAVALINRYLEEVSTISENKPFALELCEIIADWKLLPSENRVEAAQVFPRVFGDCNKV